MTFSQAVNVTGTPQVTLNVGGAGKNANYTPTGSTAPLHSFLNTRLPREIPIRMGLRLQQTNSPSTAARSQIVITPLWDCRTPPSRRKPRIKWIQPSPTVATNGISITSTPGENSTYQADETIQVQVTFSENVKVTNTPHIDVENRYEK